MEKIEFKTTINAPKEKVWNVLWDDASYREWTRVFHEGSYAVSDWQEGSKILFLSPEGDGMVSMVAANKPNEFMSFKHLGEVKNGVEDVSSEKVKQWSGAFENYFLTEAGNATELRVELDMSNEFKDYFMKTFPKALEQVKALSENS